jgi:hypothetical protein
MSYLITQAVKVIKNGKKVDTTISVRVDKKTLEDLAFPYYICFDTLESCKITDKKCMKCNILFQIPAHEYHILCTGCREHKKYKK